MVDAVLGKPSLTRWRVLGHEDHAGAATRVELEPVTGRSHQLRVHLAAIGHPILGDDLYADEDTCARSGRLLLHAAAVQFAHPESLQHVSFHSAAPF